MRNRYVRLIVLAVALALSSSVGAQERQSSSGDQPQKLATTLDFIRKRNAQDCIVSTTNGIDEAKYLEAIGPPPYKEGRGYQVQRRWSNLFEGADAFMNSPEFLKELGALLATTAR